VDQVLGEDGESLQLPLGPAPLDEQILAFDQATRAKGLHEDGHQMLG